ncbi:MAG: hypothetical protein HGJ94_10850 [Desulfosarcina sp.]|nr:hypothetical protein [Desulfosarcina sp.]
MKAGCIITGKGMKPVPHLSMKEKFQYLCQMGGFLQALEMKEKNLFFQTRLFRWDRT